MVKFSLRSMLRKPIYNAIIVAVSYLIFGFFWIYFSDSVALALWFDNPTKLSQVQTEKGLVFVACSALIFGTLVFFLNIQVRHHSEERVNHYRRLQDQLKKNENLLNSTNDLIWSINTRKELVSYNRAFLNFVNQHYNENLREGDPVIVKGVTEKVAIQWIELFDLALSGTVFQVLVWLETENSTVYLDCSFYPIYSNGVVQSASVYANDITDYVASERKNQDTLKSLREQEDFIRTILDNLPIGIAVNEIETGDLNYWNPRFEKVYGWNQSDIQDVDQFFEKVYPDPVYRKEVQEKVLGGIVSGDPSRMKWTGVKITKSSGEQRFVDAMNIPLPDQGLMVSIVQDVTDEYLNIQKLRETNSFLNILSSQASDAIVSCDDSGEVLFFNKQFQTLFQCEEPGQIDRWPEQFNMYHLIINRKLNPSEVCLNIALKDGELRNYRYRLIRSKEQRIIEASGSSLHDEYGNPTGAMVVLRDISEQIQNEIDQTTQILEAVDKERSTIARNIHDGLTQQLAYAFMNLGNIQGLDCIDRKERIRYKDGIKILKESIDESRQIAHDFMPESIRDYGLIEAINGLVSRANLNHPIEIEFTFNEERRIHPDKELNIYRIVQQAVTNALTHSRCDRISIDVNMTDDTIEIEVKDDGIGIDLENYNRAGIGILSMRKRVQFINGKLDIQSELGHGTKITVSIPLSSQEERIQ